MFLLLTLILLLPVLGVAAASAEGLKWIPSTLPKGTKVPFAVRPVPTAVSAWRAPPSVYGVTRVGARTFLVSTTRFESSAEIQKLLGLGVAEWAAVTPEWRVSPPRFGAGVNRLALRFVGGFAAKRGGSARVLKSLKGRCAFAGAVFEMGADTDHYVAKLSANSTAQKCALELARDFPELLHVSPTQLHYAKTTAGPVDLLGGTQSSLTGVGAGLTRAIMDLQELDTTHCMFWDAANPVLYAGVGSAAVRLAQTAHHKIAGFVNVCTGQPAACLATASATGSQGSPSNTHATHVTGIAVGQSCGPAQGVAPSARVLFLAIPPGSEADSLDVPANLGPALQTAAWANASSLSMSFGGTPDGMYDDMAAQIDAFVLANPQMVVTASAGNTAGGLLASPAVARNVLSVAATLLPASAYTSRGYTGDLGDSFVASFSSSGALIGAPGVGILSALAEPTAGTNHATFTVMDGTSMAAPMTPVQAAQQVLAGWGFSQPPSSLVRSFLIASAQPCTGEVSLDQTSETCTLVAGADPSQKCGFGVPRFSPNTLTTSWSLSQGTASAARQVACFVANANAVNATLVWDEPPHIPGWADPIYHPLSLYVSVVSGSAFASDESVTANHKRVLIQQNVSPGSYVRVAVADPAAEMSAEYAAQAITPPPTWKPEYEFVNAPSSSFSTVPYSLVVRGVQPAQVSSSLCGACSPNEPPVPCFVLNGTGEAACFPNGSGFMPCQVASCSPGFVVSPTSASQCVPEGSAPSNPAQCVAPLAWDGAECACVYSQMQCPDGVFMPCDSTKGLGACAPVAPWVAGENATLLAEVEQQEGITTQNTVPDTVFSTSVAIGGGIAAGLVVLLWVGFGLLCRAAKWPVPLHTEAFGLATFAAMWGVAGCVCAAVAAAVAIVWSFLVLFMAFTVWHVFVARCVPTRETHGTVGVLTKDPRFWAAFTYDAAQLAVGGGTLLGYTAVQVPDWYDTAAVLMGFAYVFAVFACVDVSDAIAILILVALCIALLAAWIAALVQQDYVAFGVLLVAFVCLAGFTALIARASSTISPKESKKFGDKKS